MIYQISEIGSLKYQPPCVHGQWTFSPKKGGENGGMLETEVCNSDGRNRKLDQAKFADMGLLSRHCALAS